MGDGYKELVVETFKNGRLKLIKPSLEYAEDSLRWVSDSEVVEHMGADFSDVSLDTEIKRIEEMLKAEDKWSWMIELDGQVIGNVAISLSDEDSSDNGLKVGSLMILIGDKEYWGKGIGYHVGKIVLKWAYKVVGFDVVTARALKRNIGSVKLLEKLGMTFNGEVDFEGDGICKPGVWRNYHTKFISALFERFRDIPYSIPLEYGGENNSCSGKAKGLKKELDRIGVDSRYVVCTFKWSDLDLPESLLEKVVDDESTHVYLEVLIESVWCNVDPTWDSKLLKSGLPVVFEWDGKSDMNVGVKVIEKMSYEESDKVMNGYWSEEDFRIDFERNGEFYVGLNAFTELIRLGRNFQG